MYKKTPLKRPFWIKNLCDDPLQKNKLYVVCIHRTASPSPPLSVQQTWLYIREAKTRAQKKEYKLWFFFCFDSFSFFLDIPQVIEHD